MEKKEVKHEDINGFITKFVTSKQGNLSFLLTNNSLDTKVMLSIQGDATGQSLGQAFLNAFQAKPEIVPIIETALVYFKKMEIEAAQVVDEIDPNQLELDL